MIKRFSVQIDVKFSGRFRIIWFGPHIFCHGGCAEVVHVLITWNVCLKYALIFAGFYDVVINMTNVIFGPELLRHGEHGQGATER